MTTGSRTTNHQSLKLLSKSILNKLDNRKFIAFNPRTRGDLQDQLYRRLSGQVLTEEDITNQVRAQVAVASEALSEQSITESDAFQSQKRAIKSRLSDNELHGFYFQGSLRTVCSDVCKFLFDSSLVEDVFESDDEIQRLVLDTIQSFDESKIA